MRGMNDFVRGVEENTARTPRGLERIVKEAVFGAHFACVG